MISSKTSLQEDGARALHQSWKDLGAIHTLKCVEDEPGIHSSNFIAEGGGQRYLLKAAPEEDLAPLQEALRLQDFCYQKNAPVPRLFPRTDNGEWILCDNGRAWVLMEFCEAHPFRQTLEEVRAAAGAQARLHSVLRDYESPIAARPRYHDLTADELQEFESISRKHSDAFHLRVVQFFKEMPDMLEQCQYPENCSPAQPVHQDCHPANVLFRSPNEAVILDFGHILNHERMLAIAFSCHRFAGFETAAVREFLRAYHAIDPLFPDEAAAYPLFVGKECLRRIHYLLRLHFFDGDTRWDFELERKLAVWHEAMALRNQCGEALS